MLVTAVNSFGRVLNHSDTHAFIILFIIVRMHLVKEVKFNGILIFLKIIMDAPLGRKLNGWRRS